MQFNTHRGDLARRWAAIYLYILNIASQLKDRDKFPDLVNDPKILPPPQNEVRFAVLGLAPVTLPDPSTISDYEKVRSGKRAILLN